MPKRTRSSGGSEDPSLDPPSKRTRSSSKSPGSAPSKPSKPQKPQKPKKPKGAKGPKKPELVTLEAKPEFWINKLPENHGMCKMFRLGGNLGSASGETG